MVVEATVHGRLVASVVPDQPRSDVGAEHPSFPRAPTSGFLLVLPDTALPTDEITPVAIHVRAGSDRAVVPLAELSMAGDAAIETATKAPSAKFVGPLPRQITDVLAALWPDIEADLTSRRSQELCVEKLSLVLATPDLRSIPAVADYARYLRSTWAHCLYVDRYFPTRNTSAREGSLDFHCKPNSIREIGSIIHQLYVNTSYGLDGDFAEFGCFKGFSSSLLSHACQLLNIRMHIFDSFEGLPPAEGSGYTAGDYCGSLAEVTRNLRQFGAIEMVEFHQGFFADVLQSYTPPPLMCLWMDVDLESSARDLIPAADRLHPRSALFSHECEPAMFQDGTIVTSPRLDNPIPPVLDRFERLDRPLTGRFVFGNTGSFWHIEDGVPVLDNDLLMRVIAAVSSDGDA